MDLSEDERTQLDAALKRANNFEQGEELQLMRQPLCGSLLKFTNVMQGWQNRWFVLDPSCGELRYYLKEEHCIEDGKPRGIMHLSGAVVVPSDDDGTAFTVTPSGGEAFKLRAADTRQRQEWINRIRTVSEDERQKKYKESNLSVGRAKVTEDVRRGTAMEGALLNQIKSVLDSAAEQQQGVVRAIDTLSIDEATKTDTLMLKATCSALLQTLELCQHTLIQTQGVSLSQPVTKSSKTGRSTRMRGSLSKSSRSSSIKSLTLGESKIVESMLNPLDDILPGTEVGDLETVNEDNSEMGEEQKTPMAHLARLKLGTDVCRVPLPPYILQPRSFLESCSHFLVNIPVLIKTSLIDSPEERILQVTKWFLTCLNQGFRGGIAKKPYNPVLGEVFRCTFVVNDPQPINVTFIAEQVSHHPPVTAVYAHCPARNLHVNAYVWPKAKFMGMFISTALVGQIKIHFGPANGRVSEEYTIGLPTLFVRSVFTNPWFELGGKVTVACEQTQCSGVINFVTKPFYGGKMHRVTADVKSNNTGAPYARVVGEWNKYLETTYVNSGAVNKMQLSSVNLAKRLIRPVAIQHSRESRKRWTSLTQAILTSDFSTAATNKKQVEDSQRLVLAKLSREGSAYTSRYFTRLTCPTTAHVSYLHMNFPQ